MLYPTSDDLRRRRLIVAGVAIVLLLLAVLMYAVLLHRTHSSSVVAPGHERAGQAEVASPESPVTELAELQPTRDPQTFARQVATALFEWDTATIVSRTDHIEQLIAVADPTGESTPGLVSDLDNYLPNPDAWTELAKYETRQWIVIDAVTTPTTWAGAQAQAGNELLPGTTALTIHGTRHRAGVWEREPVGSEHDVAFTIFLVCGPSYPECHLLRLSMLDKPLN
jgi:Na+-transporting methylmalonyl-CoA/oxaloacetate decarboxylase gamma subunit